MHLMRSNTIACFQNVRLVCCCSCALELTSQHIQIKLEVGIGSQIMQPDELHDDICGL